MDVLLVDVGNSRIKWARYSGGRLGRSQAAVHSGWSLQDYRRRLFAPGKTLGGAVISSVAGSTVERLIAVAARRAGVPVEFVKVPRRAGAVKVGYLEPWRLGVDRFVAVVGAQALFPHLPLCVAGIGTAMTIDLIGADGCHHGGVIIPGPALMVETLLERTHGIRRRARGGAAGGSGLFGRSTRAAVAEGARYAAAALIDRAVDEARLLVGRRPLVVIHGGEEPAVRPLVRSACVGVRDLVLRGLSVLAESRRPQHP
jgi:type III pantothenate kinase